MIALIVDRIDSRSICLGYVAQGHEWLSKEGDRNHAANRLRICGIKRRSRHSDRIGFSTRRFDSLRMEREPLADSSHHRSRRVVTSGGKNRGERILQRLDSDSICRFCHPFLTACRWKAGASPAYLTNQVTLRDPALRDHRHSWLGLRA